MLYKKLNTMNYSSVINYFETQSLLWADSFRVGDIFQLNSNTNTYSIINLTINKVTAVKENSERYEVTLFYVDLLNRDRSNLINIQNDAIESLKGIVYILGMSSDITLYLPISYIPFTERFTDECAGAFCTLNFEVMAECYESPAVDEE